MPRGVYAYDKTCVSCGAEFVGGQASAKFCSRTCWNRSRSKGGCKRDCLGCGTDITSRNGNTQYCSAPCRKVANRANGSEVCPGCSGSMKRIHGKQKYCSNACMRSVLTPMRRVKYAESHGAVNRLGVFKRDEWTCQLCMEPVDQELVWPDPLSKSLDHIVPLSLGGEHSEDNSQLAHLRCNMSKGNRMPSHDLISGLRTAA